MRARATVVRASGRRCTVAASTPLAALAAALRPQARRLRGARLRQLRAAQRPQLGPAVRGPDRGRAQQRPGRLGLQGQRPRRTSGSGRRRTRGCATGDRVLWFYCVLDPATRQLPALAARRPRRSARARRRRRCGARVRLRRQAHAGARSPGARVTLATGTSESSRRSAPRTASAVLTLPARRAGTTLAATRRTASLRPSRSRSGRAEGAPPAAILGALLVAAGRGRARRLQRRARATPIREGATLTRDARLRRGGC